MPHEDFHKRMEERGGIRRVAVDGTVVEADSIRDEIELDEYIRKRDGLTGVNPFDCLHRKKIIPPEAG